MFLENWMEYNTEKKKKYTEYRNSIKKMEKRKDS